MIGRPPRHPALRRGHHRASPMRLPAVVGQAPPTIPSAERQLLSATSKSLWRTIWRSPAAGSWDRDADLAPLLVYIMNVESWLKFRGLVQQAPLVRGSKDQLRANPSLREMRLLEGQLQATEANYGMNPRSRVGLGIDLVRGLSRLQELRDEQDEESELVSRSMYAEQPSASL